MINTESNLAQHFWETGKLDCPILDFHAHMHEYAALTFPYTEAVDMAHTMDLCGTRWTLFCSHIAMYDPFGGEQLQQRVVQEFPDYFRAYHSVISTYTDPDKHLQEMQDHPDVYVGCKFLCDYYRTPLTASVHAPYLEYLNENHLLALIHTWGGSHCNGSDQVGIVAEKYPNITFICGHSFCDNFDYAYNRLKNLDNIYYELTAVPIYRGFMERICENAGSDRLLFGSDLPWFATSHSIGCVLSADMTDDDRENIFWRNGDQILKRFDWYKLDQRTIK